MAHQTSFGQILMEQGFISDAQLHSALVFQARAGGQLEEALLRLHLIGEDELLFALAEQWNIAPVKIGNLKVSADVFRLLPEKFMRRHGVFPLAFWNKAQPPRLVVAMSDPSDRSLCNEVLRLTGMPLRIVLALRRDIEQAITRHFGNSSSVGAERSRSLNATVVVR